MRKPSPTNFDLIRTRTPTALESWLIAAWAVGISEFGTFAPGIRRDQEAIEAALDLEWSTGMVEGHVDCLKLLRARDTAGPDVICCGVAYSTRPDCIKSVYQAHC